MSNTLPSRKRKVRPFSAIHVGGGLNFLALATAMLNVRRLPADTKTRAGLLKIHRHAGPGTEYYALAVKKKKFPVWNLGCVARNW
jgi:hypothetical protein